jgi:hypothetical protein
MRIVWIILAVLGLCVIALGLHVYVVTRPRHDAHSRGMVRIDLHQTIGRDDAQRITAWLSRQKGVDHVMVNPGSAIAVFTYRPAAANPGLIVKAFRDSLPYDRARRYMPSAEAVRRGCPMTTSPVTNKIYVFLKNIF